MTTTTTMRPGRLDARFRAQLARLLGCRPQRRRSSDDVGYAVRCDWPLGRAGLFHDFTRFTTGRSRAGRRAAATARFWRPGPWRPLAVTVVPISRAQFDAHPQVCTSLTCPTAAVLYGLTAGELAGVLA